MLADSTCSAESKLMGCRVYQRFIVTLNPTLQAQRDAQEGEHASQNYKLQQLPAIAVIDPVTRACASQWSGYIDPHRFC